jgi:rhamnulokinase
MSSVQNYLGLDLGAENGRAILGVLDGDRLALQETYRFSNIPVQLADGLHWDVLRLWSEIKVGIMETVKSGVRLDGIGLDTWGVDFALLDRDCSLLANPFHYRDARTDGMLDEAFHRMPRADIFANTGIQFMQINTLYQLLAMSLQKSPLLDVAQTFVTIPDLLNYWLSGQITNEFTNATTTQCFDPNKMSWALPVLEAFNIPSRLFHPVTLPGVVIGPLLPGIVEETGASGAQVVLPACHDTGSAVVAVPAQNQDFAWISSGTWSIMGAEVRRPIVSEKALTYNFTNEGGVFGTWRFSKNVMGLWLVQECRRVWQHHGEDLSYDELTQQASEARPFLAVIDPDYPEFLHPGDMPERICQYCESTGQSVPKSRGEIIRVILESIALKYRWVLDHLETITGNQLSSIYIVGGGSKNHLLNRFTADATGRMCITGPVEATAIGNILMQAIALGHIGSLADARSVVRQSFVPEIYTPTPAARSSWDSSYLLLQKVMKL